MSLNRYSITAKAGPTVYDHGLYVIVTYTPLAKYAVEEAENSCVFHEEASHAVALKNQVYYARQNEIWVFTPTMPSAFSRRLCKANALITELFIDESTHQLCYRLESEDAVYTCDLNPKNKLKQPGAVIRIRSKGNMVTQLYPVSSSGRHFAYFYFHGRNPVRSYLTFHPFVIKNDDTIHHLSFQGFSISTNNYTVAILSDEQNTFLIITNKIMYVCQFFKDRIELIDQFSVTIAGNINLRWAKSISLQDGRYVILQARHDNWFSLIDVTEKRVHHFSQIPTHMSDEMLYSSPHIIQFNEKHIRIYDKKNIHIKDFYTTPIAQFKIENVHNLVAWPYDPQRGQLWAIATSEKPYCHGDEKINAVNLALVKFKKNCALEKIRDIDTGGHVDPASLVIANNILCYQRRFLQSESKEEKMLSLQSFTFNPETGDVAYNRDQDSMAKHNAPIRKTNFASSFGIFTDNDSKLSLRSIPVEPRPELTAISGTCHTLPMAIVNIIGAYLFPHSSIGWSVPPAEIKHTPLDTALFAKLDRLLNLTKDDEPVHSRLITLKERLLYRTISYKDCAKEADQWFDKFKKAKSATVKKYFFKTKNRFAAAEFLDELSKCDDLPIPKPR